MWSNAEPTLTKIEASNRLLNGSYGLNLPSGYKSTGHEYAVYCFKVCLVQSNFLAYLEGNWSTAGLEEERKNYNYN